MARFETDWLASEANLAALTDLSGAWIDLPRTEGGEGMTSKSTGLSAVLWASLLTSCAANVAPAPVERTTGRSVQLGTVAAAAVGDVIYSEFDYMATGGAVMLEPVSRTIGLGGSVQVPSGAQLVSATVDGKPGYCTTTLTYSDPLVGPSRSTCYLDSNGDSRFETLWAAPGTIGFTYDLQPPVQYRTGQITSDANGYKNELLYQGLDSNTLRIGYREYIDNLARPAFAQELTYPTNPNGATEIRFKSVRIEVLSADASEIRYRVLSGF